jgi:hypothetical protein
LLIAIGEDFEFIGRAAWMREESLLARLQFEHDVMILLVANEPSLFPLSAFMVTLTFADWSISSVRLVVEEFDGETGSFSN